MSKLIQNYIYLYHTDQFLLIPTYPESIQDSLSANFNSTTPLLRSAPIFSYASSGPRTVQITLALHRDIMWDLNYNTSNVKLNINNKDSLQDNQIGIEVGDDYIDVLIKQLQAIALPRYQAATKMVDPPMIAVRFGNELYVKGIVNGGINVSYSGPIGRDNKYKLVNISFQVSEVDPYDALTVQIGGSFRGLNRTLERRIYKI